MIAGNNEETELHTRLLKPYDEILKTQEETRLCDSEKCEEAFQPPENIQPVEPITVQIKPPVANESRKKQPNLPLEHAHKEN